MDERPILNLDGYLLALRRLSGNRCDFWVEAFDSESSVEDDFRKHLSNHNVTLLDSSSIGYKEIDRALEKHALSKLNIKDESLLKLFAWDIVEYIQMSYRLIEPDIDPISSNQAILINAESEFHGRYVYIVIPVQNKGLAVGLATRV
ncbi:MAG: hypothetical protein ACRBHB_06360 [Arenicella sp.]